MHLPEKKMLAMPLSVLRMAPLNASLKNWSRRLRVCKSAQGLQAEPLYRPGCFSTERASFCPWNFSLQAQFSRSGVTARDSQRAKTRLAWTSSARVRKGMNAEALLLESGCFCLLPQPGTERHIGSEDKFERIKRSMIRVIEFIILIACIWTGVWLILRAINNDKTKDK